MLASAMTLEQAYPLFLTYGRAERQYAAETLTLGRGPGDDGPADFRGIVTGSDAV